jgi:hypothetical protein
MVKPPTLLQPLQATRRSARLVASQQWTAGGSNPRIEVQNLAPGTSPPPAVGLLPRQAIGLAPAVATGYGGSIATSFHIECP